MCIDRDPSPLLAPLQRVMLRDSLADEGAGHHVEQVEILFKRGPVRGRVAAAWKKTVAGTEALRVAFVTANGTAVGRESAAPLNFLNQQEPLPTSWENWRQADRHRPLLAPHEVPWRADVPPCAARRAIDHAGPAGFPGTARGRKSRAAGRRRMARAHCGIAGAGGADLPRGSGLSDRNEVPRWGRGAGGALLGK